MGIILGRGSEKIIVYFPRRPGVLAIQTPTRRPPALPWSVAQTHANASGIAATNLARQGFETYSPRFRSRATRAVHQLFPGYLFVLLAERWRAVSSTVGVCRLLMSCDESPAVVSDEVVEQLRSRHDDEGLVKINQRKFHRGQSAYVLRGAFADQLAVYDGQCGSDRAFVLLSWLGAQRRVAIDEDNLAAA